VETIRAPSSCVRNRRYVSLDCALGPRFVVVIGGGRALVADSRWFARRECGAPGHEVISRNNEAER